MTITVYMDESGTHKGAALLTVAACATGSDNWERFGAAWERRLREANCSCFHASNRRHRRLKPVLLEEIKKQPIFASLASVKPEDFEDNAGSLYQEYMGNAYATCAYWCAVKADLWAEELGYEEVAYVIEHGQPNAEHVEMALKSTIELPAFRTVAVTTVPKSSFVQLQVADFLGHSRSTGNEWLPKLRRAIGESGQFEDEILTPERIAEATAHVEERLRSGGIREGGGST